MSPPTDKNHKPSILKTTREAKGLTLEIVHEATKIPMDALRAIEEGYSVRLLSPFYYRGFIKIYAEFLGLDAGEMYKQYGLEAAPKPTSSTTVGARHAVPVHRGGPNVFLEQTQEWVAFVFKPKNRKLIFKTAGFLFLFFLFFRVAGCIGAHMNKKEGFGKDVGAGHARPVLSKINHRPSVAAQSEDNKVEVAVRASRDIWLLVRADGRVVFETTLSKGSMESWSARNRIELSGRDIELLDMEVNNKQIGFLGGGEGRIRKVLITREGLTVEK